MAEVRRLRERAYVRPEPGRVVVTHTDGMVEIYTVGRAREWAHSFTKAADLAERLEREQQPDASVARLRLGGGS